MNDAWHEKPHEHVLQAVIRHLLTSDDLAELCAEAGMPMLVDGHGQPVTITAAHTYQQAGVLTLDNGVWLEFSDDSAYGLTIAASRRPRGDTTVAPVHR